MISRRLHPLGSIPAILSRRIISANNLGEYTSAIILPRRLYYLGGHTSAHLGDISQVLEDKTHALRSEAAGFSRRAVTLRRHMWWRNCKMKILCFVAIAIVLCYILVPLIMAMQESR